MGLSAEWGYSVDKSLSQIGYRVYNAFCNTLVRMAQASGHAVSVLVGGASRPRRATGLRIAPESGKIVFMEHGRLLYLVVMTGIIGIVTLVSVPWLFRLRCPACGASCGR